MKKQMIVSLSVLLGLTHTMTVNASGISASQCKSVMKDVYVITTFVIPCEKNISNPEIIQQAENSMESIKKKLEQCEESFGQNNYQEFYQDISKDLESDFNYLQKTMEKNHHAYCQGRKNSVMDIFKKYD